MLAKKVNDNTTFPLRTNLLLSFLHRAFPLMLHRAFTTSERDRASPLRRNFACLLNCAFRVLFLFYSGTKPDSFSAKDAFLQESSFSPSEKRRLSQFIYKRQNDLFRFERKALVFPCFITIQQSSLFDTAKSACFPFVRLS